jgi:hypothetical protein
VILGQVYCLVISSKVISLLGCQEVRFSYYINHIILNFLTVIIVRRFCFKSSPLYLYLMICVKLTKDYINLEL